MAREILLSTVSEIPVFSENFSLVSRSISGNGSALFLFVEDDAKELVTEKFEQGGALFPKSRMRENKRFRLVEAGPDWHGVIELPPLDITFPLVDVFPDGRVLVAATRSEWRSADDYDKNGVIFDPASGTVSRILLGDGIAKVSIDSRARIWASYFDEGIFGNFGWGRLGPPPVGAAGLNCFSADGVILWSYPFDDSFDSISDCYAMNVKGENASVYFYTEFPLCRISGEFERRYWKTELGGCSQFAINSEIVLFSRQYDDAPHTGYLAELGNDEIENVQKVEFVLPDNSLLMRGRLLGRGAEMHYFDDTHWYKTRLSDVKI